MKHARVAWAGAIFDAVEQQDGRLLLSDGRRVGQDDVVWLPPLAPVPRARTILALGLNYADHAKELAFKAPEEPLVFVKGEGTLLGHRGPQPGPELAFFVYSEQHVLRDECVLQVCGLRHLSRPTAPGHEPVRVRQPAGEVHLRHD